MNNILFKNVRKQLLNMRKHLCTHTSEVEQSKTTNHYCVIEPTSIRELEVPEFGIGKWATEEEYLTHLRSMQAVFDEYAIKKSISSIVKQLPENEQFSFRKNFYGSYIEAGDSIRVKKHQDGTYSLLGNGTHRLYVARKYKLRILVHVIEEE